MWTFERAPQTPTINRTAEILATKFQPPSRAYFRDQFANSRRVKFEVAVTKLSAPLLIGAGIEKRGFVFPKPCPGLRDESIGAGAHRLETGRIHDFIDESFVGLDLGSLRELPHRAASVRDHVRIVQKNEFGDASAQDGRAEMLCYCGERITVEIVDVELRRKIECEPDFERSPHGVVDGTLPVPGVLAEGEEYVEGVTYTATTVTPSHTGKPSAGVWVFTTRRASCRSRDVATSFASPSAASTQGERMGMRSGISRPP